MAKDIAALFPVINDDLEMLPLLGHGILPSRRAAYPDNFWISKQMGVWSDPLPKQSFFPWGRPDVAIGTLFLSFFKSTFEWFRQATYLTCVLFFSHKVTVKRGHRRGSYVYFLPKFFKCLKKRIHIISLPHPKLAKFQGYTSVRGFYNWYEDKTNFFFRTFGGKYFTCELRQIG